MYVSLFRQTYIRKTRNDSCFGSTEPESGDRNEFIRLQSELLNRLRQVAASGGSKRKYAQGDGPGPPSYRRFFAATQCTPDLSEKDCNDCLLYGFRNATKGRVGIRWFCPSCNFQIESNLRFFRLESEYEPDSTTEPPGENKTKIIIATVGSVVGFSVIIICETTRFSKIIIK